MKIQVEKERILQIILEIHDDEVREEANFVDNLDDDLGSPASIQVRSLTELRSLLDEAVEEIKNGDIYPADEVAHFTHFGENMVQ